MFLVGPGEGPREPSLWGENLFRFPPPAAAAAREEFGVDLGGNLASEFLLPRSDTVPGVVEIGGGLPFRSLGLRPR